MATTYNSTNAFTTLFGDDVTHAAQAMASKLQGSVRTVRNVTGSTYRFPILGKGGVVKNKVAHQDIEPLSALNANTPPTPAGAATWVGGDGDTMDHSKAEATIDSFSTGEYIDNLDALKSNLDLRSAYAESIAASMNRAWDSVIIGALDAASSAQTVTEASAGTLAKADFLAVHQKLNEKDVPMNDRYFVVDAVTYNQILDPSTGLVNSADGPLSQALATGVLPNVLGFNIILSNDLTVASGQSKSYAYHKNAVGCAIGKDITTRIDYVPSKMATLIAAEFSAGAVAIDQNAIVQIIV